MSATARTDVPRLIRIVTLLFAILAGALVYFAYEPATSAFETRVDDAHAQLRSDEVAFSEIGRLRSEREALVHRYAKLFAQNAQAVFLRELASNVRRRGLSLVATSASPDAERDNAGVTRPSLFSRTRITLELEGPYRNLLAAIAELSVGSEIVAVDAPSLHRDAGSVVASIPVTIFELPDDAAPAPSNASTERR